MPTALALVSVVAALLSVGISARPAVSGPWSRAEGETFASVTVEADRQGNSYGSLYAEYGFGAGRTLGIEFGHTNVGETAVLVWAQRQLDDGSGPNRFSLSLGAGAILRDGEALPLSQGTLAWGRGFGGRFGPGWISARGIVKLSMRPETEIKADPAAAAFLTPQTSLKAELTLGIEPRRGVMLINELWLEDEPDMPYSVRLASSAVLDVAGPLKLHLGVVQPLHGVGNPSVRLGSWITF